MKKYLLPVLGLALLVPAVSPTFAAPKSSEVQSVTFHGSRAPETVKERATLFTDAKVEVVYSDGTKKMFPLSYKKLFKTTDKIGGIQPGVAIDADGKPIMDNSVENEPIPYVSDGPDGTTLFQVEGASSKGMKGNPLYSINHYEYTTLNHAGNSAYGVVPASMGLNTIEQNKKDGSLKVKSVKKVDFSDVDGLWIPCNASLSPWNTHLGSEEYEPDARAFAEDPSKNTFTAAFTQAYYQDAEKMGNPYLYGFTPEISVNAKGATTVTKHYSMGRFSKELAKVMPDQRTVYFGDDGGYTMLFMYVADKKADLSAGTLYAGKWIQRSDKNGGSAKIEWIPLGHATDDEVKEYADTLTFSDMFETASEDTPGFKKIRTYSSNGKDEWLKLKPGMEKAAAFLEPRRYAAMLGATSEFNKMEGVTYNNNGKRLYIAMSYVEKGMLAEEGAPADDIRLPKLKSGTVYEMRLTKGQKDKNGKKINSEYVANTMSGLISGTDLANPDEVGNTAAVDNMANPDNIAYSEAARTLFIGEDSGMHVNNFVWAYNVDTKKLSRILSVPAGGEATGLSVVDDLNGFSYITSNVQHPGDQSEMKNLPADLREEL
ncbi:MAG: PhoX family protein, partial [Clostridia bacterium]